MLIDSIKKKKKKNNNKKWIYEKTFFKRKNQ